MHRLLKTFILFAVMAIGCARAETNIGPIIIPAGVLPIPITVSAGSPELTALANVAFNSHGRYRTVASGGQFDLRFTEAGAGQMRVDVTRGGTPVLSQVVSGTSPRNALLRAADLAVKATCGLNGFFASQLAFIGESTGKPEIYVSDLYFREIKKLTSDRAQAMTPRWSPDGSRIIYTSYFRSGFPDIFAIDLGSMHRDTFVSFKGTNSGARFSPDGREVAMVLSGEGNPEIYVSDAQGRHVARRTHLDTVKSSPCWSPDGSRLVFAMEPGPQLYVMPSAGGTPQRLPTGGLSSYCAEPDWSRADPNKIVFTVHTGKTFAVAVADLSGRTPAKVVSKNVPGLDAVEPTWLADGRHVVCTSRSSGLRVLYLLDTESGKATRLSPTSLGECSQASVRGP